MKTRLDRRLTELKLAPSRAKAQEMIRAGEVEVPGSDGWVVCRDVSHPTEDVRVTAGGETLRFVSRGGRKLEGALTELGWDVTGWRALDLGLSTGGFTDCLLKRGAAAVLGIDVGRGQTHASLTDDPRLTAIEGVNARDLATHRDARAWLARGVDLAVADLSFISLTLVIPALAEVLPAGARVLLLVKPQFETDAARLNKRGVVTDPAVHAAVRARVTRALELNGFVVERYFDSVIAGQDGNREFFVAGTRGPG